MTKVNFKNLPDTSTPLNASNLNSIQSLDEYNFNNYLTNSWATTGEAVAINYNGLKIIQVAVRYGTSTVLGTLPSALRPSTAVLVQASNRSNVGYVRIKTNGEMELSGSEIFVSGSSNAVYFNAIYL